MYNKDNFASFFGLYGLIVKLKLSSFFNLMYLFSLPKVKQLKFCELYNKSFLYISNTFLPLSNSSGISHSILCSIFDSFVTSDIFLSSF